jgi:hypothetical protein
MGPTAAAMPGGDYGHRSGDETRTEDDTADPDPGPIPFPWRGQCAHRAPLVRGTPTQADEEDYGLLGHLPLLPLLELVIEGNDTYWLSSISVVPVRWGAFAP